MLSNYYFIILRFRVAFELQTSDGYIRDEISPFDKTNIVELKEGKINEFTIDPKDLGINS